MKSLGVKGGTRTRIFSNTIFTPLFVQQQQPNVVANNGVSLAQGIISLYD